MNFESFEYKSGLENILIQFPQDGDVRQRKIEVVALLKLAVADIEKSLETKPITFQFVEEAKPVCEWVVDA